MNLLRATRLIAGLFFRRMLNRSSSGLRRRKKTQERVGTGRKSAGSVLLALYLFFAMGFGAMSVTSGILRSASEAMGPCRDAQGRMQISKNLYRALADLEETRESRGERSAYAERIFRGMLNDNIKGEARERAVKEVQGIYKEEGIDGFVARNTDASLMLEIGEWNQPELKPVLLSVCGLLLLLLAVWRFFFTLGSANQDLGKVEWNTEWLFTLPVSARNLFAAQILGLALADPLSWLVALPFLFVLFHSAGMGWNGLAAAFCGMVFLSLMMAALRVASETWLRKQLAPARLKNLQALFTLLGIGAMFILFMMSRGGALPAGLVDAARKCSGFWMLNPFALPMAFCIAPFWVVVLLQAAVAGSLVTLVVGGCAWLVRDGLLATSSVFTGTRNASKASLGFLSGGIIGKDVRLLLRDRNFLVQTLVAPVLVVGFQVFMNGSVVAFSSNFQHASTFAFGLGAYVLIATALSVLSVEGNSLWMLYALPVPLYRIMLRKTMLWAGCALFYTFAALVVCGFLNRNFRPFDILYAGMACGGVIIYAFIASGIGMLGTDPLETEVRRRIRPDMIYLYMGLSAMYGYAIYAPTAWTRLGQIILSSLLAYALWQKVRDRSPYLLDPIAAPPRQISLADGLIAALAFFVFQGVFGLMGMAAKMGKGTTILLAFVGAGFLVVLFTLLTFRKDGRSIFRRGDTESDSFWSSVGTGMIAGLGAATFAVAYLAVLQRFPIFEKLRETATPLHVHGSFLILLAVVAAPLFEEFIFRGMVFNGMRRSLPLVVSAFGSAAIFAICHPPVSVLPVFVMGAISALAFERTGRLAAPIATHMVYNAIVISATRAI